MSIWNYRDIKLHEVQLGNLFYVPTVNTVIITAVNINGIIQVADYYSGNVHDKLYRLKDLSPIDLPPGSNISLLDSYLKFTNFRKHKNEQFIEHDNNETIVLERTMECYPKWKIHDKSKGSFSKGKEVEYIHELQNHYTILTGRKLILTGNFETMDVISNRCHY